ncbi:acyl-CoA dehydrogenase family protein [Oceanibacterium hippocampi]|uniref:Glutaryl-CoA dehydrogenase n=1 Tax=Oceanibacterium hippocampi TaxID=745714 RepID=A0A1Y5S2R1_9PROT|nr:acyl-CoA dehydrogenase family protein [Oceanibacterium hippocampi]SLN29918.1 Glutaryl-CoA dehydrogenase [Oceanibacterium hippocampi]
MNGLQFTPRALPGAAEDMRRRVRDFLARAAAAGHYRPGEASWNSFDAGFSRRCGEAGLIGVTWPRSYGGEERSYLERYVIMEEMLAAGAPVGAHWIAERQSGPQILTHAHPAVKARILPEIAAGRCFFGIGMSEPDSGSDLASVRTRATQVDGGWKINGRKIWTTNAGQVNYLNLLARTGDAGPNRHGGLTQFIVDLSKPGVEIRPIRDLTGRAEFCEEVFDDYFVPDEMVLGKVGEGWSMVTGELAYERSGPDRILSPFNLLREAVRAVGEEPDDAGAEEIGRWIANVVTLRRMSVSVAGMLADGKAPNAQAALVKDLGTTFERELPEQARLLAPREPEQNAAEPYTAALAQVTLNAPSWTIRGGTREILRGIIARELGLR